MSKLGVADKLFIQQVTGIALYYVPTVAATMVVALSAIASNQASPTEETMEKNYSFLIMLLLIQTQF